MPPQGAASFTVAMMPHDRLSTWRRRPPQRTQLPSKPADPPEAYLRRLPP